MTPYFSRLNEREKWMVLTATLCILLYVFYLVIYQPLTHAISQKSAQLVEKIATLQWMQKVRQQNQAMQTKQIVNNSQLLTLLATQLKNDPNLKFSYQLRQTRSGEIQLSFDSVAFNLLIEWLEKINKRYAVTVKQFEAQRTQTPGVTHLMILIIAHSSN